MNFYMKNKRSKITLVILLFIGCIGHSQSKLSDTEVAEFKTKVKDKANRTNTIVSDFTQTKQLFVLDHVLESNGKLVFKAPNLVRWEYMDPYQNVAIFKDNQLLVNNESKRQNIDLGSNKMFRSLNSLIVNSIKGDMFDESQFELSFFGYDDFYLVKFIPRDKRLKKFIAAFEMKFSKDSAEVDEIKLIEPNDDYTVITFHNQQVNIPVEATTFQQD